MYLGGKMKIKVNYELMEKWIIENQEPVKNIN